MIFSFFLNLFYSKLLSSSILWANSILYRLISLFKIIVSIAFILWFYERKFDIVIPTYS